MTNAEEEAERMFEEFIEHCEQNNILPQYIMYKHFNEEFWENLKAFWRY